jgi:hypothetical protein
MFGSSPVREKFTALGEDEEKRDAEKRVYSEA